MKYSNSLARIILRHTGIFLLSNSATSSAFTRHFQLKLKALVMVASMFFMISFSLAFSGPVAAVVVLYGTSTGFGTGEQGSGGNPGSGGGKGSRSQFHRVDITTGVAHEISMDIGFGGDVGGLAADSSDVLFAGTGGRGPNMEGRNETPTLLFTIDPRNGLGDPAIGPLGIEFGPPESSGQGPGAGDFDQYDTRRQNIAGWSFDPVSGNLFGMTAKGSQLYSADTTTGLATRIGTPCDSPVIGAPGGRCGRGNAIAFDDVGVNDSIGTLFWTRELEISELDPATGLIVGSPVALAFLPFGPPTDPGSPFRVVAMDYHPVSGDLYAAVQQRQARDSPPAMSTLAILDPRVGTFIVIGAIDGTGVKLDGIAFTSAAYVPPPECNIELNREKLINGDTVTANILSFVNPSAAPVAIELKMWLGVPDISPLPVTNVGSDGSFMLPAGTVVDLGPAPLLGISASLPRGSYEFSCRMRDPVTGELLAEERNFFEIE